MTAEQVGFPPTFHSLLLERQAPPIGTPPVRHDGTSGVKENTPDRSADRWES